MVKKYNIFKIFFRRFVICKQCYVYIYMLKPEYNYSNGLLNYW